MKGRSDMENVLFTSIMMIILAPCFYIMVFEFELLSIIEEALSYLFGPGITGHTSDCNNKENPY